MHDAPGRSRGWLTWPWALALAALAFGLWGARPLWEPDEGRYGEAAREMAVGGDWLVPRLQGRPHLTKPPLTYWLSAAGLRLTGVGPNRPVGNAWGARLFVGAAFFGTLLCIGSLARCWGWSALEARLSALVYGTALLPFACGHILTTDMLLTFWETLCVLCAWRVWLGQGSVALWRWGFWVALGMAFLTKGWPALLVLLPVVLFWWFNGARPAHRLWAWGGLALGLFIGLTWYGAIWLKMPDAFGHFVVDEGLDRVMTGKHGRSKPFWFYAAVVPLGMTPWLHLWPGLILKAWRRIEGRGIGNGVRSLDAPALFSLLWVVPPLIVFQFSGSKMYLYVAPLMVPVAIWMGRLQARWGPGGLAARGWARALAVGFGAVWCAGLLAFVALPDRFSPGRSLATLAAKTREVTDTGVQPVYVYGNEPHSISFYSGATLRERDPETTTGPFMKEVEEEARRGGAALLLIRRDDIGELGEREMPWVELAGQHEWVLVRVTTAGATPFP